MYFKVANFAAFFKALSSSLASSFVAFTSTESAGRPRFLVTVGSGISFEISVVDDVAFPVEFKDVDVSVVIVGIVIVIDEVVCIGIG